MDLPVRSIREIKKLDKELEEKDIFKIIELDNLLEEIKKAKEKMFSNSQKTEDNEYIEEIVIVEFVVIL